MRMQFVLLLSKYQTPLACAATCLHVNTVPVCQCSFKGLADPHYKKEYFLTTAVCGQSFEQAAWLRHWKLLPVSVWWSLMGDAVSGKDGPVDFLIGSSKNKSGFTVVKSQIFKKTVKSKPKLYTWLEPSKNGVFCIRWNNPFEYILSI